MLSEASRYQTAMCLHGILPCARPDRRARTHDLSQQVQLSPGRIVFMGSVDTPHTGVISAAAECMTAGSVRKAGQ